MHLTVSLVDGACYAATAKSLPVLYHVIFDRAATMCGPIHVAACLLSAEGGDDAVAGYVRNVTSLPGRERRIHQKTELVLAVDALEHEEEDACVLQPGRHEISAKVRFQLKEMDGAIRWQELRASQHVTLL